ncbi:MAG TPA: cytochrome c biogenesis protein ResB [Phycisphaerae bacterium]|nr:cytochrome c biogenesis protein ResB [Phycisphaerae bacterium]
MSPSRSILRSVGSLWFAAVLLVLLLVGMACATVVESMHGPERALTQFYESWWFKLLLGLLAVNVLAAALLRFPFTKRHIGFVIAHGGILVTLGGALVTGGWGIDGRLGLVEGESAERFTVSHDVLTIENVGDETRATADLTSRAFGGLDVAERPKAPRVSLGDLRGEIQRYLPDSVWSKQVTNDNPQPRLAVEVSLSATGRDEPTWVFAGEPAGPGELEVDLRVAADEAEVQQLMAQSSGEGAGSKGRVEIEYQGLSYKFPAEDGLEKAVPLGETGYTARVLRYLPHAKVEDKELINASDRPVNPAIEVEFQGPAGTAKRLAFAKFPEFGSLQGEGAIEGLDLTFVVAEEAGPRAPIEVIAGPEGALLARLSRDGVPAVVRELKIGEPVETPWPGYKFAVLQRFDQAKVDWTMAVPEETRETRVPAILVKLTASEQSREVWVQRFSPRRETLGGATYELSYANKSLPLGFALKLNQFHLGTYPGTRRPRSFESRVTITDPSTGREQDQVISMNHPISYGGYNLFQSAYNMGGGQTVSYLSVSRDPGQPIVFAGYIAMMVGMVVVLITRVIDKRQAARIGQQTKRAGKPRQKGRLVAGELGVPPEGLRSDTEEDGSALEEAVGRKP